MTEHLSPEIRAELRKRTQWILEHHTDPQPARVLVRADHLLAVLNVAEGKIGSRGQAQAYVDVLFDGPPGPESGRFVETEGPDGSSIAAGEWIDRGNGLHALRIPLTAPTLATRRERRDADLAQLMAEIPERQPQPPVHMETTGGRHRRNDAGRPSWMGTLEGPVQTDAQIALAQGMLVDPDSGNLR